MPDTPAAARTRRVLVVGATGTIGRATVPALLAQGWEVTLFIRPPRAGTPVPAWPDRVTVRTGAVTDAESIRRDAFRGERFDAVVSCLASRTGAPDDAWAIDYRAHVRLLAAAMAHGVTHVVLLSAICVQKPRLAFQHAKLAFERELMASGLTWSIVRPTAYFKSLVGQVQRVQSGKPFLIFGDGSLTACKPISDRDLAEYIAGCLDDPSRFNRVLPIGGPGPALTAREQGEALFRIVGRAPRFTQVPPALLSTVARVLGALGRVIPPLRAKAEFARIGHYYATESMLVWDAERGCYDAEATPEHGRDTLPEYFAQLVRGAARAERGEHAVF
jgi:divinyl chlorophyllide a 8-vinyl-reductase